MLSFLWVGVGVFAFCVCFTNGFLIEGTTTPDGMTESHFLIVMKLFSEEKQQRNLLEAIVTQMHSDLLDLQQKYLNLQQDHSRINDVNQLLQDLANSNFSIESLTEKLNIAKQLESINEIQDIRTLKTDMRAIKEHQALIEKDVNMVITNQQARAEDFMALYNLSVSLKASQEIQAMSITEFYRWKEDEIHVKENFTKSIIALNRWKEENEKQVKVGLTSCVTTTTTYYDGDILKFPNIKTHFGISSLPTFLLSGIFTCEYPGLYLVSPTIMSRTKNAAYEIFRNSSLVQNGFVSGVNSHDTRDNNYHTGTSMIIIDLKPSDKISVKAKGEVEMDYWNCCLTIIKIS